MFSFLSKDFVIFAGFLAVIVSYFLVIIFNVIHEVRSIKRNHESFKEAYQCNRKLAALLTYTGKATGELKSWISEIKVRSESIEALIKLSQVNELKTTNVRCIHRLKIWPIYFEDVVSGVKTFDIRKDDRDFQVGDALLLQEYDPYNNGGTYTLRVEKCLVIYKLDKSNFLGIETGYCVLGIKRLSKYDALVVISSELNNEGNK